MITVFDDRSRLVFLRISVGKCDELYKHFRLYTELVVLLKDARLKKGRFAL